MIVSEHQIQSFTDAVLDALGVCAAQRDSVTRNIVWNELDGRTNFGLQRLATYAARLKAGGINPAASPKVTQLTGASASVDGDNGFGQYASELAMNAAIKSAQQFGIGIATVHRSNFFGSGAYFVSQACAAGMIGFAMSNSFPKVAAYGGKQAVLGTNPFAFGAPLAGGAEMIADFATSALAGSTVRDYLDRGDPLPPGSVADDNTDKGIVLTPFGGAKGFAIALLVEMLSGVLAGAGVSNGVNSMYKDLSQPGENGQALLAINAAAWGGAEAFLQRMALLQQTVTGSDETRLPGETRAAERARRRAEGVDMSEKIIASANAVAAELGLPTLDES